MERHGNDGVDPCAAREIHRELECVERAEVLGQPALAAVLEPTDGGAKRAPVYPRRANREAPLLRDRIALVATGDAEPAPGLAAASAARHQQDVAESMRELHHL